MKFASVAILAAFLSSSAIARAQEVATPLERALSAKLLSEINANLQANAKIIDLEDQIKALKASAAPKENEHKPAAGK